MKQKPTMQTLPCSVSWRRTTRVTRLFHLHYVNLDVLEATMCSMERSCAVDSSLMFPQLLLALNLYLRHSLWTISSKTPSCLTFFRLLLDYYWLLIPQDTLNYFKITISLQVTLIFNFLSNKHFILESVASS